MKWCLIVVLICVSLITNEIDQLFICLLAIGISAVNCLFISVSLLLIYTDVVMNKIQSLFPSIIKLRVSFFIILFFKLTNNENILNVLMLNGSLYTKGLISEPVDSADCTLQRAHHLPAADNRGGEPLFPGSARLAHAGLSQILQTSALHRMVPDSEAARTQVAWEGLSK